MLPSAGARKEKLKTAAGDNTKIKTHEFIKKLGQIEIFQCYQLWKAFFSVVFISYQSASEIQLSSSNAQPPKRKMKRVRRTQN